MYVYPSVSAVHSSVRWVLATIRGSFWFEFSRRSYVSEKNIFGVVRSEFILLAEFEQCSPFFLDTLTMKSAKPIQIIKKKNHTFYLELDELEPVFASDELKNRHVVIVSIAGDLRKGKSFLLSFFIKYLNAQV